jgi:hypothetical protein
MLPWNWRWLERMDLRRLRRREDGAETEGKNGGVLEAVGDDACMVHAGLLVEGFRGVVFADDDGEVAGRVKEYLVAADAETDSIGTGLR